MRYLPLLLLSGCFFTSHYDHGIEVAWYEVPNQDIGIEIVEDYAEIESGINLDLNSVTNVYWTTTLCWSEDAQAYKTAVIYRDICYNGLTFDVDEVYVAWRGSMGESAFAHELGHAYRIDLGWDPDGQHLDISWWEAMDAAAFELRLEGL
jgi:hypothetical protein